MEHPYLTNRIHIVFISLCPGIQSVCTGSGNAFTGGKLRLLKSQF